MKIKLTKWERETLYKICKTLPGGTLGQIEQDMQIMEKLKLSDNDTLKVFAGKVYDEEELRTLNSLLSKVNLDIQLIKTLTVYDETQANTVTELTFDDKDVKRLVEIGFQGRGYPKHERTLALKKRLEDLKEKTGKDK